MFSYKATFTFFICLVLSFLSCKKGLFPTEELYSTITIKETSLPDFSYAGFEKSEKAIPFIPSVITLEPDTGDNWQKIQGAINQVSLLQETDGYRGAILLKAGVYKVSKPLKISTSGIVLRGEGQGSNGTVILANGRYQYRLMEIAGGSGNRIWEEHNIKDSFVPFGADRITVDQPSSFQVRDTIVVVKTPNDDWLNMLQATRYGWTKKEFTIAHRRVVKAVTKNYILLDIPLVDAIDQRYGGGYVAKASFPERVSHCGIENIRLQSIYNHDEDEEHAWTAVRLFNAVNCWVRNITALYFGYSCVVINGQSDFNTVQDCAMLDPKSKTTGRRKYSFDLESGMGNLFQRCYAKGGRHDFVTGARVTGPNVFLDCLAVNTYSGTGPHHRWATGILYDNVKAGLIEARHRVGGGHGWAGAQNMFWNVYSTKSFLIENPPGAVNWCVGCRGSSIEGNGYSMSWGLPVKPRSLYLEQLKNRLGDLSPEIIREQMDDSDIWDILNEWAGEGTPLSEIQ